MKKVTIIGASGSLAPFVVKAIDKLKVAELTLFVRSKNRLSGGISKDHTIVEGHALNFNNVKSSITGQEIVYVNLAGDLKAMITNIVKAMLICT